MHDQYIFPKPWFGTFIMYKEAFSQQIEKYICGTSRHVICLCVGMSSSLSGLKPKLLQFKHSLSALV